MAYTKSQLQLHTHVLLQPRVPIVSQTKKPPFATCNPNCVAQGHAQPSRRTADILRWQPLVLACPLRRGALLSPLICIGQHLFFSIPRRPPPRTRRPPRRRRPDTAGTRRRGRSCSTRP